MAGIEGGEEAVGFEVGERRLSGTRMIGGV